MRMTPKENGKYLLFRETQIGHTHTKKITFAVYGVSINDNYVMGRDGRGSIINLKPHEVRNAQRMQN